MDRIFILHADHEQNASTSTVRLAGSSGANPFACIASGIAALWGPAHGGANEAVLRMLDEIGDVSNIDKFVEKAKDKNDPFKLMGFGHRVYKNFDPRAKVMKQTCDEVLQELGINDPQLELAMKLEEIARHDPYFVERNLYPNVDFYSGIILKAIGIPTSMFTVIFALARTVGWISHWQEMLSGPYKIGRPRQLYTGHTSATSPPSGSRLKPVTPGEAASAAFCARPFRRTQNRPGGGLLQGRRAQRFSAALRRPLRVFSGASTTKLLANQEGMLPPGSVSTW